VITYRATLGVPRELVAFTSRLLAAERRRRGTPRGSRKLTCYWQAVLGLRWFRDKTAIKSLAADHGVSRATGYRYVDEVIEVLAAAAPELPDAPGRRTSGRFIACGDTEFIAFRDRACAAAFAVGQPSSPARDARRGGREPGRHLPGSQRGAGGTPAQPRGER
jgi:hypothetical protein